MSKMSDYLEGQLRAHIFRTASFTKPTGLWIALHTADPTDAATGAEATYTNYGRINLPPLDANWTAASLTDGNTDNASIITFAICTGSSNLITHFSIWDAVSGGNMLCYGQLTNSFTVSTGVTPKFGIGDLDITFQ